MRRGERARFSAVRQALRFQPAPIPWTRAVRSALTVAGPFCVGLLAGHPIDGLLVSLGSLPAANADRGGAYVVRALRMAGSVGGAALGLWLGSALYGTVWIAIVAVAVGSLVAGLVSTIDAVASLAALNFLVYMAIAASDPLPRPGWYPAVLALVGGAWGLALLLPGWLSHPDRPEVAAVRHVYDSIADLLAAVGTPSGPEKRLALTLALNAAEDAAFASRLSTGGRSRSLEGLWTALSAADPLIRAATDRMRRGAQPSPGAAALVRRMGGRVTGAGADQAGRDLIADVRALPDADLRAALEIAGRAVGRATRSQRAAAGSPRVAVGGRAPLTSRIERRLVGRGTWTATARLVASMTAAEILAHYAVHDRPYWIPLTVAVVMKPDFGSVFARAVQRAVGTTIGVLVGAGLVAAVSGRAELVPVLAALTFLLPIAVVRNYALFVAVLTPIVLIQVDALERHLHPIVVGRLVDTLLGCAVVLLIGYLPWRDSWRTQLPDRYATAARHVARYVRAALEPPGSGGLGEAGGPPGSGAPPGSSGPGRAVAIRRQAYRGVADLRTATQQTLAEPRPARQRAEALWPAPAVLETILDETTAVALAARRGEGVPSPAATELLASALEDLADRIAAGALPVTPPLPDDPMLGRAVAQVRMAAEIAQRQARVSGYDAFRRGPSSAAFGSRRRRRSARRVRRRTPPLR